METNTFKDLLPEDLRNCEASPAVWAYIADLLAKVSEQQKEIKKYREELKHLMERRDYWKDLAESKLNEVSEQSQRIQQLEGLLKRTLQYNFEPRHPEHPVYKLIAEIKVALNL